MGMVNMARSADEIKNGLTEIQSAPIYPYGLSICLTHDELDKLSLDADCEVGDMIHIVAMAKVTSISKNATEDGESCRIELQITDMQVEDEDLEDTEEPQQRPARRFNVGNFYKDRN